jgi:hypothetical protein
MPEIPPLPVKVLLSGYLVEINVACFSGIAFLGMMPGPYPVAAVVVYKPLILFQRVFILKGHGPIKNLAAPVYKDIVKVGKQGPDKHTRRAGLKINGPKAVDNVHGALPLAFKVGKYFFTFGYRHKTLMEPSIGHILFQNIGPAVRPVVEKPLIRGIKGRLHYKIIELLSMKQPQAQV